MDGTTNESDAEDVAGMSDQPSAAKFRTPPYISYRTFLTLLNEMKTNDIPPQVDRSVLKRFAGGLQSQLLMGLRSLALIDDKNRPTTRLSEIVEAYETERFKPEMARLLADTYPYVFALDLKTATPAMFAEAFKSAIGAKEDVLRKCRTFFLHAAKDADVPLGPRISTAQFPRPNRNGAGRRTKTMRAENDGAADSPSGADSEKVRQPPGGDVVSKLLEKFPTFDPNWSDELKAKWFAGFEQFMKSASKR
jgi:hypothetical protein